MVSPAGGIAWQVAQATPLARWAWWAPTVISLVPACPWVSTGGAACSSAVPGRAASPWHEVQVSVATSNRPLRWMVALTVVVV